MGLVHPSFLDFTPLEFDPPLNTHDVTCMTWHTQRNMPDATCTMQHTWCNTPDANDMTHAPRMMQHAWCNTHDTNDMEHVTHMMWCTRHTWRDACSMALCTCVLPAGETFRKNKCPGKIHLRKCNLFWAIKVLEFFKYSDHFSATEYYYTLYNPVLELQPSPHPILVSKDPCFISITFSVPNSNLTPSIRFRTPYAWPWLSSPFLPIFPAHPDWRYCNPVLDLLIPPCYTHIPALFSVVIKASCHCIVESVWILTQYNPLAHQPLWLSLVWNAPDLHSPCCGSHHTTLKYRTWWYQAVQHTSWSQVHPSVPPPEFQTTWPGVGAHS